MRRLLLTAPLLLLGLPALAAPSTPPPADAAPPATSAPTPAPDAAPAAAPDAAPAAAPDAAPAPTPVLDTAPVLTPEQAAMAAYEARKLKPKALDPLDPLYDATRRALPGSSTPPWAVAHGNGEVVSAKEFATSTGDTATANRISRTHKNAKILQWSLTGAGVALLGLSVLPLLSVDQSIGDIGEQPSSDDFTDSTGTPDLKAYTDALTLWRKDKGIENRNRNKVLTAVTLGSTGLLAIASSPFAPLGAREREGVVPLFYSQQEADDRMLQYNIGVKKELGIVAPDPVDVVIPAAPPPPPVPEDGDDLDDGLEDGGGGPPLKPSDSAPIQVHPWLGFGFLGLQGTF